MRLILLLIIQFSSCMLFSQMEKRLALLIGNSNYQEAPLRNPVNDVKALGTVLENLNFTTTVRTNRNLDSIRSDINRFRDQISAAKRQGFQTIACIYYSGHGMQIRGINYLIPVDHQIEDQTDVKREAYEVDQLLEKLQLAKADVNIVILDACRNNPFEKSLKGRVKNLFPELEDGLADVGTPTVGTLIAYATAPGKITNDGDDRNSPYAKALTKYLPEPGITIEQVFRRVRNDVLDYTRDTQIPWEANSLRGDDLYLKAKPSTGGGNPPATAIPANMALVAAGTFIMNEGKGPSVNLSPFIIDKTEVTFAMYDAFCEATGRSQPNDEGWGRGNRPVINVDWYDAVEYCNWRSSKEGLQAVYTIDKNRKDPNNKSSYDDKKWLVTCDWRANGYRLPTEAEWEYAAGGGKRQPDKWAGTNDSNELKRYANISGDEDSYKITAPVKSFEPNSIGLYDMSGNVYDWCWDWYKSDYSTNSQTDPHGPNEGEGRVIRGGSWQSLDNYTRVAFRYGVNPEDRGFYVGFRCLRAY